MLLKEKREEKDRGRDVRDFNSRLREEKETKKNSIESSAVERTYGVESKLMLLACVDDADL